jgi:SAM-dependent methyltransferase
MHPPLEPRKASGQLRGVAAARLACLTGAVTRERRLIFGEVAVLYDRSRPSYPPALVDDLVALAGLDGERPVLEVGSGTGKATVAFASRGIPVLALEPSEEMASIGRRNCAGYPGVRIEVTDFERWRPGDQRYPLIFAAQSWHWIEPEVRYRRAREALAPGGVLAAFWNRPRWERVELREALRDAYARTAPDADIDGPMHPANPEGPEQREDWGEEIARADGLGQAEVRSYEWTLDYSAAEYADLLGTLSDHRLLPKRSRCALLDAVSDAIGSGGDKLRMRFVTRLCLARAL